MARFRRNTPDMRPAIAFTASLLLLSFFLVLVSVGKSKPRTYSWSLISDNTPPTSIAGMQKRNVLSLYLNKKGELTVNGESVPVDQLYDIAKEFIDNPDNELTKPEKAQRVIPYFGPMLVTYHHLISFRYERETSFEAYLSVMGELTKAYSALRNDLAEQKWQKKYVSLSEPEQKAVCMIYPRQISEVISKK